MKNLNRKQLEILSLLSYTLFLVPASILGLWIYIYYQDKSQSESLALYKGFFPDFLQGRYDTLFLSAAFCLVTIVISGIALRLSGIYWKKLNITIFCLSFILLLLNLLWMM